MNYGNGFAPISLTVERPVLHLVLNAALARAELFKLLYRAADRILFISVAVKEAGIDHFAVSGVCFLFNVAALYDFNDVYSELVCELPVALVVRGNSHYGSGPVAHHNIVGNVYRYLLAGERIYRRQPRKADAGLILDKLCTLEFGLFGAFGAVSLDLVHIGDLGCVLIYHRMLGRHDHKCHAEERVGTRGVYAQLFIGLSGNTEVDERTLGFAYPVDLLLLYVGQIIDLIESFKQTVRVLRYAQIPYVLGLLHNVAVADIALAAL